MLCEKFGKREAAVRVVKIINGKRSQAMLCEECARQVSSAPLNVNFDKNSNSAFPANIASNLLGGILDGISKDSKIEVICKNCGLKYSEYKNTGKLGCSECYESFSDLLILDIKESQQSIEHVGKIPVRAEGQVFRIKQIKKLKEELQKAILEEEYEKAAILRDKILAYESEKESE
ncbi:Protein-arginine kinase activator protein McsA [Clostridium sp. DSM 8431]|uniref:UvrB/UvrC motif-containing protein n=1 Tax=Clostridium sp. DSM 8431 TaxID=1761781 RepID=UPI0008EA7BD3|nr:UvrB/UvrC motif-containing protein [Clostridium sp. DSM 8431]SFU47700.1 Protein-arginine kinase activator protein McsA [Clostridium sp. DSM 8431]